MALLGFIVIVFFLIWISWKFLGAMIKYLAMFAGVVVVAIGAACVGTYRLIRWIVRSRQ